MSVRAPDPRVRPTLTDDLVADYLRARGDGAVPDGLLAAARAEALRPTSPGHPWRFALGMAAAAMALVAMAVLGILAARPQPTPSVPVASPVLPARELVVATYHDTDDGGEVLLRPADPATARPLEGFEPIAVAQPFETHLSPDGRTLAILTWRSDQDGTGTLRLIDLVSWTVTDTPVAGLVDFRGVTWTPDAQALVWLAPTQTSPTVPVGRAFEVLRWVVGAETTEHLLTLPDADLRPLDARLVGPSTLAVYGRPIDAAGEFAGAPRVLAIDLDERRVLQDVELADETLAGPDADPAVVWDLPRQRLLVATDDRLTTVGLPDLAVTARPIGTPLDSAAPSSAGTILSAALSADGERLYLSGLAQTLTDLGVQHEPVGLRVVSTSDGSLVAAPDPTIGQLLLSPTGDRLLGASWQPATDDPLGGRAEMRLLDPDTLKVVATIPGPDDAVAPYPAELRASWDGRFGYAVTNVRAGDGAHPQLQVVDLADGRLLEQRDADGDEPLVSVLALGGS